MINLVYGDNMSLKIVSAKEDERTKIESVEYLVNNLDNLDFNKIELDVCDLFNLENDDMLQVNYVDYENSITIVNDIWHGKVLCINSRYYYEHKEDFDKALDYICLNKKSVKLSINDSRLISKSLLNCLNQNKNVKDINLGNEVFPYTLDKDTYLMFKEGGKKIVDTTYVSEELSSNFDEIIGYNAKRKLINSYNYKDMNGKIIINSILCNEEIDNLKYLGADAKITIGILIDYDNCDNIFAILRKLKELNKENQVTIDVKCKSIFNNYLFRNLQLIPNNIKIKLGSDSYKLEEYLEYEKRLYKLIEPAINLSPFERCLYAYNVTKKFKKYKENKRDLKSARHTYQILDNDYIVCAGFSNLLGDLLSKLQIESLYYSVGIDVGLDKVGPNTSVIIDDFSTKYGGHARRIVNLVDPKYEIDGIYIADPTWDNDLDHDLYTHALMTQDEYLSTKRYSYYEKSSIFELFIVENIQEFYSKANYWMNEKLKQGETNVESKFIFNLVVEICKIDKQFFQKIKGRSKDRYTKEELQNILYDIGTYIVSKVNSKIDVDKYKKALTVIYDKCYKESEVEKKVADILYLNSSVILSNFPKRYKINPNGEADIYINTPNKFEQEDHNKQL